MIAGRKRDVSQTRGSGRACRTQTGRPASRAGRAGRAEKASGGQGAGAPDARTQSETSTQQTQGAKLTKQNREKLPPEYKMIQLM